MTVIYNSQLLLTKWNKLSLQFFSASRCRCHICDSGSNGKARIQELTRKWVTRKYEASVAPTLPSALTADSRQHPALLPANGGRAHYRRSPIVLIEATLTTPFLPRYKSTRLVTLSLAAPPCSYTGNWIVADLSVSWLVLITSLDYV